MILYPGDHVCAFFSSHDDLAKIAAGFLAEGVHRGERCWYLAADDQPTRVREILAHRGLDVTDLEKTGALVTATSSNAAYAVGGEFDPEMTLAMFSNAIEQALTDGFTGFRAAANMSWALDLRSNERLVTYEAMLRSLFATARATGLCLYDRSRMPLAIIDGALGTHPFICTGAEYRGNPFYNPTVQSLNPAADPVAVRSKLNRLRETL